MSRATGTESVGESAAATAAAGAGHRPRGAAPRVAVMKFGGSSVADAERIRTAAARVVQAARRGFAPVVVVSAQGDTTDLLLAKAREITDQPSGRELDMLLATGEQISIALMAMALQTMGQDAVSLTGAQCGIRTDEAHTKAKIVDIDCSRILAELTSGRVAVVAGFQGVTEDDDITTLGRGGSDTTAVALAAALGAEVCEIYTDVPGVFSADPRVVPGARKLDRVSYDEMLELAALGARVLHLRCVEIAKKYGVPLHVRSSFSEEEGTLVTAQAKRGDTAGGDGTGATGSGATAPGGGSAAAGLEKGRVVIGIAHTTDVAKVTIKGVPDRPGIAARLFEALAAREVNVDMIIQSGSRAGSNDISFTVGEADLPAARAAAEELARDLGAEGVEAERGVGKVSIVGAGMVSHPGVAARMFRTIADQGVNIQMISTSDISISCVIDAADVERVVRALHRTFIKEA